MATFSSKYGTVNANASVEYVSYYDPTATIAGGTFSAAQFLSRNAEGSMFAAIVSTNTGDATTRYTMNFRTPTQIDDLIVLEMNLTGAWTDVAQINLRSLIQRSGASNCNYGMYVSPVMGSTLCHVDFGNSGQVPSGSGYATLGSAWSGIAGNNALRWRVRRVKANAPAGITSGYVGTDWAPLVGASLSGMPGTLTAHYRRDGQDVLIRGIFVASGAATTDLQFTPPAFLTPDSTAIPLNFPQYGTVRAVKSGVGYHVGTIRSSGSNSFLFPDDDGALEYSVNRPFTWASGDTMQFELRFSVVGWSSNIALSTLTAAQTQFAGLIPSALGTKTIPYPFLGYIARGNAVAVPVGASSAFKTIATLLLAPGEYNVGYSGRYIQGTGSTPVICYVELCTTANAETPISIRFYQNFAPASSTTFSCSGDTLVVTTTTTYYLNAMSNYTTAGNSYFEGGVTATLVG